MNKDRPEPSPITATAQQPVASSRAESPGANKLIEQMK